MSNIENNNFILETGEIFKCKLFSMSQAVIFFVLVKQVYI